MLLLELLPRTLSLLLLQLPLLTLPLRILERIAENLTHW